jgi:hypothetical protein
MAENILLHPNVACVTKIVSKDGLHFATGAVHVVARESGYRVEATDCKRLVRVDGDHCGNPENFPAPPALLSAPNTASAALVPPKIFEKACKDAPKRASTPERRAVAVRLGAEVTTLCTMDEDGGSLIRQPRNAAGRFPNTNGVIPTGKPMITVRLNASSLAELLEVAAQFSPNGDILLEVFGDKKPVKLTCENDEQKFVGLLMPVD